MQMYPYAGVEWTLTPATKTGTCYYSGKDIAVGDDVYVSSHPAFADSAVLAVEYERYLATCRQRGYFSQQSRSPGSSP